MPRPRRWATRCAARPRAIVANMEASLGVPTATSFREVPAKLLEVNRQVINGYLGRTRGGKVSFTHLIGYAVVRAIADTVPVMNSRYVEGADGKPARRAPRAHRPRPRRRRREGRRLPHAARARASSDADTLDFRGVLGRVRGPDPQGPHQQAHRPTTSPAPRSRLTNPGTIGTVQSVPRLMPGQGVIVGVGALDYPAEFAGRRPGACSPSSACRKVITITSTYDHRIIQGAESGLFLKRVHELLLGEDDFYDEVFRSLGVPYEAVRWRRDVNPVDHEAAQLEKQMQVDTLVNMYRVRGHLIADLDPLAAEGAATCTPSSTRPPTASPSGTSTASSSPTASPAATRMPLGDMLARAARRVLPHDRHRVHAHPGARARSAGSRSRSRASARRSTPDDQRHILDRLNAAEAFEKFLGTKYIGQKRFGIEGAETAIPMLDAILERGRRRRHGRRGDGHGPPRPAQRAREHRRQVATTRSSRSSRATSTPTSTQGSGDVKYHLGPDRQVRQPQRATSSASSWPPTRRHLEAVDPVVEGMARAKQDLIDDAGVVLGAADPHPRRRRVRRPGRGGRDAEPVDAPGLPSRRHDPPRHQQPARLHHRRRVGALAPEYATDVAKMVQAPIFHVNGDDPEACVRVARLAFAFRQAFHKDVVIDMVCYRRHGHNEGDEPSYTQPLMYKRDRRTGARSASSTPRRS